MKKFSIFSITLSILLIFSTLAIAQFEEPFGSPMGSPFNDPGFGPGGPGFGPGGPGPMGGPGFGGPQFEDDFRDDYRRGAEVAPGVMVEYKGIGPRQMMPDFKHINEDEMILGFIGPILFSKIGDPEEILEPLCPDIDAIAAKVSDALEDEDFEDMCSDLEFEADNCESAIEMCEDIKNFGPRGPNGMEIQCPVSEESLIEMCKQNMEKRFEQAREMAKQQCEFQWQRNGRQIEQSCKQQEYQDLYKDFRPNYDEQRPEMFIRRECPQPQACGSGSHSESRGMQNNCPVMECVSDSRQVVDACGGPGQPACSIDPYSRQAGGCGGPGQPACSIDPYSRQAGGCGGPGQPACSTAPLECPQSPQCGSGSHPESRGTQNNCPVSVCVPDQTYTPPSSGCGGPGQPACSSPGAMYPPGDQQQPPQSPPPGDQQQPPQSPPPSDQPPVTQSASRISGLIVGDSIVPSPGVPPAIGLPVMPPIGGPIGRPGPGGPGFDGPAFCDEEGFMANCLQGFEEHGGSMEAESDKICGYEAKMQMRGLKRYCKEKEKYGDPYDRCVKQSTDGCNKMKKVLTKCKASANREAVVEIIKKKARVECARISFQRGSEFGDTLDVLDDLELTDGTREDSVQLDATRGRIVLTAEELEKIKAEVKADVIKDILTLLGLNQEGLRQAAEKQREQIENLKAARESMADICEKVEGDAKEKCDEQLEKMDDKIKSLEDEAKAIDAKAGGIMGVISSILGGG